MRYAIGLKKRALAGISPLASVTGYFRTRVLRPLLFFSSLLVVSAPLINLLRPFAYLIHQERIANITRQPISHERGIFHYSIASNARGEDGEISALEWRFTR